MASKIIKTILSPEQVKAGDRFVEGQHRQKKQLTDQIQQFESYTAPDGDADITNAEIQAGRPLHRSEVMRRLARLNPNLRYEQAISSPDKGGIYVVENRIDPATMKAPWKRFVCGIPHDRVTEFHVPCTVDQVIPDPDFPEIQRVIQRLNGHIPGWRAVLLKLLRENLVTPAGVDREFKITQGRVSQKWQQAAN